jgi:hypothetical protein
VHFVKWLYIVIAAVSSVSCAPSWTPEKIWTGDIEPLALPIWTADGLYLVSGRSGALFLTPAPPDLHHYRGVVLEEIQISTNDQSRDLKPFEEERLKGYFTRRLEDVFRRNGWPIVETPGEDVLRARLTVTGLKLRRWRLSHFGLIISNASLDQIAIALELRDGVTGDRRLLFGDNRRLPFGVYNGSDSVVIKRVEDAFYDFSTDIRRRLEQVQRGEFPPPPRPSGTKTAASSRAASVKRPPAGDTAVELLSQCCQIAIAH